MAPPKYKDIAKSANDLMSKDYCFDKKFKLTTVTENGVEFTTEGLMRPKAVSGSLAAKFKPFSGITVKKLSVTTAGRFITEATLDDAMEGVAFTVKAQEGADIAPTGELSMDYARDSLKLNSAVNVTDGPTVYTAGTFALDGFILGGEMKYNTQVDRKDAQPSFEDYNVSLAYSSSDFIASLVTKKKASIYNLGVHHNVSSDLKFGATFSLEPKTSKKLLSVGGIYTIDKETKFQGKVDSNGIVSCNAIQTIKPQVKLIASTSVDTKSLSGDSTKFGLQLILG